jgi:hypothetical protein
MKNLYLATFLGFVLGVSYKPAVASASVGISESAERMAKALERIAWVLENPRK